MWALEEPILHNEYFNRTTCGAGGSFEFAGLRPGNYYACAFTRVGDSYLLQDIPFARAMQQRATRVKVEKGQTAGVELKLVPWPE